MDRIYLYRDGYFTMTRVRDPDTYTQDIERPDNSTRQYRHSKRHARTFICRALRLVDEAQYYPSTMLLTYSHTLNEPWMPFSRLLTNFRNNYGMNSYAAALEVGGRGKLPHIHCIMDMPRYDPLAITRAWSFARGYYSRNAVRDMRMIQDIDKASAYAAKYAAKIGKDDSTKQHPWRKYRYSSNLLGAERIELPATVLRSCKVRWEQDIDYCTIGYVADKGKVAHLFSQEYLGLSVFSL